MHSYKSYCSDSTNSNAKRSIINFIPQIIVVVVGYLTTVMYYSYGQRPSLSVDGWYESHMITGTNVIKIPRHLSYGWGKTPEKSQPGIWPDRGSNPGPLRDRRAYYTCPTAVDKFRSDSSPSIIWPPISSKSYSFVYGRRRSLTIAVVHDVVK